jgi:ABC-type nitrate/sulfonate/bicarbonate transport system permease component
MLKKEIKGFYLIIILLLVWQLCSDLKLLNRLLLPPPSDIVKAFFLLLFKGQLMADISSSIRRVLVGFAFASLLGVPLGIVLGWNKKLSYYFLPTIEFIRPIPPIAWIPLAILWFGIGNSSSYFITALASFFPIFINSFVGAQSVEKVHINAAQSLGASKRFIITHILFPSALPFIITGIRVGLGVGWMSVIAAELIAAQSGLGYMIQLHRMLLNVPEVIVGMAAIGVIGSVMNSFITYLQRKFIPWRQD